MRHAQESGLYLKGQGHTLRSKVKIGLNSACPDHYSEISQWNLKLFHICIHLHQLVWHAPDPGLYLKGKGHTWIYERDNGILKHTLPKK